MRIRFASIPVLLVCLAWNQGAAAQVNEKFADMADEIELVRSMVQVERQSVVAEAMVLTDQEATAFWPVYNEYRAAVARINMDGAPPEATLAAIAGGNDNILSLQLVEL